MKAKEINVSKPDDSKYGYLSNSYLSSIVIDGLTYPSVENYVQSQRVSDEELKDKIRTAPLSRIKSLLKNGSPKEVSERDLEKAMKEKFKSPRLLAKLIDTGDTTIVDKDPRVGKILNKIRGKSRETTMQSKSGKRRKIDLPTASLSKDDERIVDALLYLSKKVSEAEGSLRNIYTEMVEDAIYSLPSSRKLGKKIATFVTSTYETIYPKIKSKPIPDERNVKFPYFQVKHSRSGPIIPMSTPNLTAVAKKIQKKFSAYHWELEYQMPQSEYIALALLWYHTVASPEEKEDVLSRAENYKSIDVSMLPVKRWYRAYFSTEIMKEIEAREKEKKSLKKAKTSRGKKPKKVSKVIPKEKPKVGPKEKPKVTFLTPEKEPLRKDDEGSELFLDEPEPQIEATEEMGESEVKEQKKVKHKKTKEIPDNLTIVSLPNNKFAVRGKSVPQYKVSLLELGGTVPSVKVAGYKTKIPAKFEVQFSLLDKEEVEDFIFSTLPDQDKYVQTYMNWIENKLSLFFDAASTLADIQDRDTVERKDVELAVSQIYKCKSGTSPNLSFNYSDIISKIIGKYKIEKDASKYLIQQVNALGDKLISPLTTGSYKELKTALDRLEEYIVSKTECIKVGKFGPNQSCFLTALSHLSGVLAVSSNSELSNDIIIKAFLLLIPKRRRNSAMDYIKYTVKEIENRKDPLDYLRSQGINMDMEQIQSAGFPSGELVAASALQYFTNMLKAKRYREYLLRAKALALVAQSSPVPVAIVEEELILEEPTEELILEEGSVVDTKGNIFDAPTDWVGVLVPSSASKGLDDVTKSVYKMYPYSNIFKDSDASHKVGSVSTGRPYDKLLKVQKAPSISHKYVASLITEMKNGPPSKTYDTAENRKKWFQEAVNKLANNKISSIAFDKAQLTDEYVDILQRFAAENDVAVYIVLPEKEEELLPETAQPYGLKDIEDDIERGAIYSKILVPLNLSVDDLSTVSQKLEELPRDELLRVLNDAVEKGDVRFVTEMLK